jgi:cytoskeletal protein RodZ
MPAAVALLVLLALVVWNSRRHRDVASASPSASAPAASSASPSQPTSLSSAASSSGTNAPAAPSPVAAAITESHKPAAVAASAPSPKTAPPAAAQKPRPSTNADDVADTSDLANTQPATVIPPAADAKALKTFTLLIRAEQTTWVQIVADGKPIAHETLIAPAHTAVSATSDIVVKTGNAAGVSFLLNGTEFPAQGNVGEVKTYVFDAAGLKTTPPTSSPAGNR